jgi:hypothetical protein
MALQMRMESRLAASATEGTQIAPFIGPGALAGRPVIPKKQGFRVVHRRLSHA